MARSRRPAPEDAAAWDVTLAREFRLPGFAWAPGRIHRVSPAVLRRMRRKRGLLVAARPA